MNSTKHLVSYRVCCVIIKTSVLFTCYVAVRSCLDNLSLRRQTHCRHTVVCYCRAGKLNQRYIIIQTPRVPVRMLYYSFSRNALFCSFSLASVVVSKTNEIRRATPIDKSRINSILNGYYGQSYTEFIKMAENLGMRTRARHFRTDRIFLPFKEEPGISFSQRETEDIVSLLIMLSTLPPTDAMLFCLPRLHIEITHPRPLRFRTFSYLLVRFRIHELSSLP